MTISQIIELEKDSSVASTDSVDWLHDCNEYCTGSVSDNF